jgi:hypothetical protein
MKAKTDSEVLTMTKKPIPTEPGYVACEVCLAEIPESVAMSSEGDEYTQHFCGIDCYNRWREENEAGKASVEAED